MDPNVTLTEKMKPLSIPHAKFVAAMLGGATQADAARAAGYSSKNARCQGAAIAARPEVQAALTAGKATIATTAMLDAGAAMALLDEHLRHAVANKQGSAGAKLIELKMKLAGLLDAKATTNQVAFSINFEGVDAPVYSDVHDV